MDAIHINTFWEHKDGGEYKVTDILYTTEFGVIIWYNAVNGTNNNEKTISNYSYCRTPKHFLSSFTKVKI